jgi:hypothetical protein
MSDLNAGLRALLGEPGNTTVHWQLIDRLQEQGVPDVGRVIRQWVIENKGNDGPSRTVSRPTRTR